MKDYSSEACQEEFTKLRNDMMKQLRKAKGAEKEEIAINLFNDICLNASKNDPVAQDYLAYIFKKGFADVVPVNYEKFMQWEILAGANGNQYSIDKLTLFLSYPMNEVMAAEDFESLIARNNLTIDNYQYVLGRLFCEAIVDELRLDAELLLKEPLEHQEFDGKVMHAFDRARNFVIPKVLKFLRN